MIRCPSRLAISSSRVTVIPSLAFRNAARAHSRDSTVFHQWACQN
jgi:hypothetical protein